MKVYIVSGCPIVADYEQTIVGVYAKLEDAQKYADKKNEKYTAYWYGVSMWLVRSPKPAPTTKEVGG